MPDSCRGLYDRYTDAVSGVFERGIRAGRFDETDPLYLALCLEGVINAFVSYWSMREPEEDLPTRIEKMQKVFLERIRRPPHAPGPGAEEQDRR